MLRDSVLYKYTIDIDINPCGLKAQRGNKLQCKLQLRLAVNAESFTALNALPLLVG